MKNRILIFGGTTEGRVFAGWLKELGIPHVVSVATEYGKTVEEESGEESLLVGRMDRGAISELIRGSDYAAVVDATHPYAIKASQEIRSACEKESFTYLRLLRKDACLLPDYGKISYVDDVAQAAKLLDKREGKILLLTGSRDLKELTDGIRDKSRLYVRIIPDISSIEKCQTAGLTGRQIIAMQGPFSADMNVALIKELGASVILTKDSGETGGFGEKIEAAYKCGIEAVVIKNPERDNSDIESCSPDEVLKRVLEILEKEPASFKEKKITLGGLGPGDDRYYTAELAQAIREADIIFGAEQVLERLGKACVPTKSWYEADAIDEFLNKNPQYRAPLVVFSGDISLCSGAKKAGIYFEDKGYRVKKITGISSVALFAGKIGVSLEDVTIISTHGKECDVYGYVRRNEKVILLTASAGEAIKLAKELSDSCNVTVGCELGSPAETEARYGAADYDESIIKGKVLLYIENPAAADNKLIPALRDDEIIRGEVPMTKEEVRGVSLRKLGLTKDSVLYDVGAGTGSISLEAALLDPTVKVYSIEKKEEAVTLLYRNRDKFGLGNMEIIEGSAPEALEGLPMPSHVFIGGSNSGLQEIILRCVSGSGRVRFVVNCVTLETLGKTMDVISSFNTENTEVVQISASRYKEVGSYHMAEGMNPVFVIAFELEGKG